MLNKIKGLFFSVSILASSVELTDEAVAAIYSDMTFQGSGGGSTEHGLAHTMHVCCFLAIVT
jgi:hypothetical protein